MMKLLSYLGPLPLLRLHLSFYVTSLILHPTKELFQKQILLHQRRIFALQVPFGDYRCPRCLEASHPRLPPLRDLMLVLIVAQQVLKFEFPDHLFEANAIWYQSINLTQSED